MSGVASGAYNAAAGIGRGFSYVSLGFGIVFSLIIIILGTMMMVSKKPKKKPQMSGGVMIGFGLFVGVITGFSFYLKQKYKPVAAISGAVDVFDIGRGLFHK
jgi:hypothetical protein